MAAPRKIIEPRAAADLKPTDLRSQMLRDAKQDKLRKDADKLREAAKEQAADKKVRRAKDVDLRKTRSSSRASFVRDAKKAAASVPRAAADLKPGDMRSTFLEKAKSAASEARGGSTAAKGFLKKLPVVGTAIGFIADASPLNKGETEFMEMIKKKAGKGYGDKPVGPFKPAAKTTIAVRKEYPGSNTGNRAVRKAAGTYTASYDVKEAPKVKTETPKEKSATVKTASDKSRLAPKMTNFQRMKARQFEKEGVAGRSMTAAQAKRKATEKGSSIADLRKLFGLSRVQKAAPGKKSLSSEFAKKNLAANQKIGKSR